MAPSSTMPMRRFQRICRVTGSKLRAVMAVRGASLAQPRSRMRPAGIRAIERETSRENAAQHHTPRLLGEEFRDPGIDRSREPPVVASPRGGARLDRGEHPRTGRHPAARLRGVPGRQRPGEPHGHGDRARRTDLRVPSRAAPARHQERRPAADAVRDRHGRRSGRARAARHRVRPELRDQQVRLHLLHQLRRAEPAQPHQPVHRQRRDATDYSFVDTAATPPSSTRSRSSTSTRSRRPPTTTAARSTSAPDGKLYVAVGDNASGANAQSIGNAARQDPAHQRRRHHPRRQPHEHRGHRRHHDRRQPRHLGRRAAQPVHLHVPARHRA